MSVWPLRYSGQQYVQLARAMVEWRLCDERTFPKEWDFWFGGFTHTHTHT